MLVGLEAGDRSQVESCLTAMRAVAASVPEPSIAYARLLYESAWACAQGELQAAEPRAIPSFEAGTAAGQPDAISSFGILLFQVRYFQGRAGELDEQSVRLAERPDSYPAHRAAAALALIESGRADEARKLALAEEFQTVPSDWFWPWTMFIWADACSRLHLRDRVGQ